MSGPRFVSSGNGSTSLDKEEAWAHAQKAIDASKTERQDPGRQEGGKSLYEVLQQNKAAKQEAFEESIKLKNQFKALEEDEVEFLDSVLEKEREKNEERRKETQEQLELFRKQQREVDTNLDPLKSTQPELVSTTEPTRLWAGSKKRKRPKVEDKSESTKANRESRSQPDTADSLLAKPKSSTSGTATAPDKDKPQLNTSCKNIDDGAKLIPNVKSNALGLSAYDDSEDE